jgi:hypothetical protein
MEGTRALIHEESNVMPAGTTQIWETLHQLFASWRFSIR